MQQITLDDKNSKVYVLICTIILCILSHFLCLSSPLLSFRYLSLYPDPVYLLFSLYFRFRVLSIALMLSFGLLLSLSFGLTLFLSIVMPPPSLSLELRNTGKKRPKEIGTTRRFLYIIPILFGAITKPKYAIFTVFSSIQKG